MDVNTILATSGISTTIIIVVGVVYKLLNHCSVRSKCCGREGSINVDLSPPKENFLVNSNTKV